MKTTACLMTLVLSSGFVVTANGQEAEGNAQSTIGTEVQNADARIDAVLSTAAEAGIPVSLLESKVSEGNAKGVPAERIADAVESRLNGLLQASETLGEAGLQAASAAELAVTADALDIGVDASTVAEMALSAPESRRAVAIAVLADLVQLGMESGPAMTKVTTALSEGPQALANLHAETAASLRASGAGPGAGADIGIGIGVGLGVPNK